MAVFELRINGETGDDAPATGTLDDPGNGRHENHGSEFAAKGQIDSQERKREYGSWASGGGFSFLSFFGIHLSKSRIPPRRDIPYGAGPLHWR
jgi:hypothetical protein